MNRFGQFMLLSLLAAGLFAIPVSAKDYTAFPESALDLAVLQTEEPEVPEEPEEPEEAEEEDIESLDKFFEDDAFFEGDDDEFEAMFEFESLYDSQIPTIELLGGLTTTSLDKEGFGGNFAEMSNLNARLGYSKLGALIHESGVSEFGMNYIGLKNIRDELIESGNTFGDVRVSNWSVGLGSQSGYAWRIGKSSFIAMYSGNEMNWGKNNFEDEFIDSASAANSKVFSDDIHYGECVTAGMKVRVGKYIGLTGEYEIQHTYPRFMTWKWLGSKAVQGIAGALVSEFTDEIKHRVPEIVPVIDFVLKSAVSYGYYELSKESTHWPFNSAPPLRREAFRVGMSFTF